MTQSSLLRVIESWIVEKVGGAGASGAILGLSGGIDSAVLSVLLRRSLGKENMLAVIMPCHSAEQDREHAEILAKKFDIPTCVVDLTKIFDEHKKLVSSVCKFSEMSQANTKSRLRMTTLYALGQSKNFLVCGTSNKAELTVGYFTKYGDSGSDILPLADLLKSEVRGLAEFVEIPKEIIDKPPSAGLWNGQTDEDEMGITYEDLDKFLLTGEGSPAVTEKIKSMNARSAHKRIPPPVCEIRNK